VEGFREKGPQVELVSRGQRFGQRSF